MKISLDHGANAYGDNMGMSSRIYHLKPNKRYTVSMWVKTSPGRTVAAAMSFVNVYTPPEGYPAQPPMSTFVFATDEWKRMSVTGYALDYPTPDYQIRIEANELEGGYLWVDGIQLEEGDLTAYAPSSPVIAGVYIGKPGNISYSDEAVSGTLIARNASSTPQTATWRYEIYDFMNRLVGQGGYDLSLQANTTEQAPINIGTGKQGIFRLVSWIDRMEHTSKELVYAVIPRPPVSGLDPTSYLGIHPNYTDNQLSLLQQMGIKWSRVLSPSGFFRWNVIEPVEGQIAWFDTEISRATARGLMTMGTIGTNNFWPAWADNGGVPDLA
jgi:hypothetical protein